MTSSLCRLCCSTASTKLTNSIYEDVFIRLFNLVPKIELSDDSILSKSVCQLCYGKAKISFMFLKKIIDSQQSLKLKFMERNKSKPSSLMPSEEVIRKIQKNSGISIKKVIKTDPIGVQSSPEQIFLHEENSTPGCDNVSTGSSEEVYQFFGNDSDDSNYKPSSKSAARRTIPKPKEVYIDAPINYSCAKCKRTFDDFETLSNHMKERSCVVEEIICSVCDKKFPTKKSLYVHMVTHRVKKKFICGECGTITCSQFDLESHKELIHQQVVNRQCIYRCTHCQEVFGSQLDLLNHVKEHAKERKESSRLCEVCARECPNLRSYHVHMLKHRNKKSFVCDVCGKGFMRTYQLTQHMHVHTGIKSFICEICQKSYAKRESLRLHLKKEHPK